MRFAPASGSSCGRFAAFLSALAAGRVVFGFPAPTARFLSAVRFLVHRRPGAAFGFLLGGTALLVPFLDVLGLAFLLVRVTRFVSSRHSLTPWQLSAAKMMPYERILVLESSTPVANDGIG